MKIERFEDIEAWKEAKDLVKEIYRSFAIIKDYSFKDQIQRAALSILMSSLLSDQINITPPRPLRT
jgi:23S rRNA-intervening sequence protein